MPQLVVFNRYLRIGGDDVSAPLALLMIGRLMWLTVLVIILYLDFQELSKCTNGIILRTYLTLTVTQLGLSFCIDCLTLKTSLQGTMVEQYKRKGMTRLIRMRFTLSSLQILFAIVGIVGLSYNEKVPCEANEAHSDVNKLIFSVIIISQFLDSCLFFTCATLLIGTAPQDPSDIRDDNQSEVSLVESRFREFLKWIESYGGGNFGHPDMNDSIEQVAAIITKYFHNHGFLDVVLSDILAGIILVRTEQRTKRYRAWERATTTAFDDIIHLEDFNGEEIKTMRRRRSIATLPHGIMFDIDEISANGHNIEHLRMISRCSIYAAVIYNRILPLNDNNWNNVCHVCQKISLCPEKSCVQSCCCCWIGAVPRSNRSRSSRDETQAQHTAADIHGLNFIGFNRIGVTLFAQELAQAELVFLSFRNDTVHKPFAIFVDHQEQYIVITIRGTLSVEDAITDAACDPVEMREAGKRWGFNGRGRWAHSGMLRAALVIRGEIEEARILNRIYDENMLKRDVGLGQPIIDPINRYANYKLVVTGHSLGAGTAILLAMLLKPKYPTIKCFGFGTPGSTVDIRTCKDVSAYATSIVMGNDIVSRLSYRSLCNFRDEILLSIARAKVNKTYIMQAMFCNINSDELMYRRGEEPDTSFLQAYHIFQRGVDQQLNNPNMVEMYLPGRILHLVKSRIEWKWCTATSHYALIQGRPEDYTDIVASTTMVSDHSPDFYHQEIHRLFASAQNLADTTVRPHSPSFTERIWR